MAEIAQLGERQALGRGTLVLAALSLLATGSYQKPVGMSYLHGLSQPSGSNLLREVVDALNHPDILAHHIHSPRLYKKVLLYINELLEITSNPIYSFADNSTLIPCMQLGKPLPSQKTAHRIDGIQKLGALFRCSESYTSKQLLLLYKKQMRPSLDYCSHVWGCAPKHSLKLLDAI
nr:unnamed protein product [Callosobruchus analis]